MRHVFSLDSEYALVKQACDHCPIDFDRLRPEEEVDDTFWYPREIYSIIEAFYKYQLGILADPPCIWLVAEHLSAQNYHGLVYELRSQIQYKLAQAFPQGTQYYRYAIETNITGRLYIRTLGVDLQRLQDDHNAFDDVYDPFDADEHHHSI